MKESSNSINTNPEVIRDINKKFAAGVKIDEFESIRKLRLTDTLTVEDLVESNLKTGNMRKIKGKITTTGMRVRLKLSSGQYQRLLEKAEKEDKSIDQLASKIIDNNL